MQLMDEAQRAPYVQMAKEDKVRSKTDPRYYDEGERDILTAQGIPYSQVRKEREEAVRKEESMKRRTLDMVNECFMNGSMFGWTTSSGRPIYLTGFDWFQLSEINRFISCLEPSFVNTWRTELMCQPRSHWRASIWKMESRENITHMSIQVIISTNGIAVAIV